MNLRGYRAFLAGTATDLPCRPYVLKFPRRDDVESRRRASGVLKSAADYNGRDEGNNGTEGN